MCKFCDKANKIAFILKNNNVLSLKNKDDFPDNEFYNEAQDIVYYIHLFTENYNQRLSLELINNIVYSTFKIAFGIVWDNEGNIEILSDEALHSFLMNKESFFNISKEILDIVSDEHKILYN